MTALAADAQRDYKEPDLLSIQVGADETIYKGALVMVILGTGYAVVGADTANGRFRGVATAQADNSSGLDGAIDVQLRYNKVETIACTGADITWMGYKVYIVDDNTVALAATTTNDVLVGEVVDVVSATSIKVLTIVPKTEDLARADLDEDALQAYVIPVSTMMDHTGIGLAVSATAGTHNINLDTNVLSLQTEVANNETETSISWFQFQMPPEYVAAGDVKIRCIITVAGAGTSNASTVDFSAYRKDLDGTMGADIVATAAQAIIEDSYTTRDFVVTAATLSAGDIINVKCTTAIIESATDNIIGEFEPLQVLCDIKG